MDLRTPAQHANDAAEAIRAVNHLTFSRSENLRYPSDAYDTVASLKRAAWGLPQSFDQLRDFLHLLADTRAITADHGAVDDHLAEARSALASASLVARTLGDFLDTAHNALAPLGYVISTED